MKYNMIQQAFKWREMKKQQSDEELYKQMYDFLIFIVITNHIYYLYKNYNNTPYLINFDLD